MKLFLAVSALLFQIYCHGQEKISFQYDSSGNQIVRELICITCEDPAGRIKNSDEITESDFTTSIYDQVKYYPNPVLETLYIQWQNKENNAVTSIEVYSMTGQLVTSKQNLVKEVTSAIEFQNLSQGLYNVVLVYTTGEKKVLKVVKK